MHICWNSNSSVLYGDLRRLNLRIVLTIKVWYSKIVTLFCCGPAPQGNHIKSQNRTKLAKPPGSSIYVIPPRCLWSFSGINVQYIDPKLKCKNMSLKKVLEEIAVYILATRVFTDCIQCMLSLTFTTDSINKMIYHVLWGGEG